MSKWLNKGEAEYLKADNEWNLVLLDIADLIQNYNSHPHTSDSKEYAARAISFVVSHIEREPALPKKFSNMAIADAKTKEDKEYLKGYNRCLDDIQELAALNTTESEE